jgi:hypothetical protein
MSRTEPLAEDWAKVKLLPQRTGLANGGVDHPARRLPRRFRVKVSRTHGGRGWWPDAISIAVGPVPRVIPPGQLSAADFRVVSNWIALHHDVIIDYSGVPALGLRESPHSLHGAELAPLCFDLDPSRQKLIQKLPLVRIRSAKVGTPQPRSASDCSIPDDIPILSFAVCPRQRASAEQQGIPHSSHRRLMAEWNCTIRGSAHCNEPPNTRRLHDGRPFGCRTRSPRPADRPVLGGRLLMVESRAPPMRSRAAVLAHMHERC